MLDPVLTPALWQAPAPGRINLLHPLRSSLFLIIIFLSSLFKSYQEQHSILTTRTVFPGRRIRWMSPDTASARLVAAAALPQAQKL